MVYHAWNNSSIIARIWHAHTMRHSTGNTTVSCTIITYAMHKFNDSTYNHQSMTYDYENKWCLILGLPQRRTHRSEHWETMSSKQQHANNNMWTKPGALIMIGHWCMLFVYCIFVVFMLLYCYHRTLISNCPILGHLQLPQGDCANGSGEGLDM